MSKKRKDLNKRKGGLFNGFKNWLLGELPPDISQVVASEGHSNIGAMPAKYDDTPLEGDRYVGGKCCRTVGEYKAAVANDPTMGGWSG